MKFILGKKIEMTQKFLPDGEVVPVTAVAAGPCFVTTIKNIDKDHYKAVAVGYGTKRKLNKPQSGQLKNLGNFRNISEFRLADDDKSSYEAGQKITASVFTKGDVVDVIGVSKGKGFQGVVKRHGFHGANRTHGTKDQERHSGSVGPKGPAHTFKGTRMGGRMGGDQVTVKNLEIIDIDDKNNILFVKGAVPGARNGLLKIIAEGEMKLAKEEKNIIAENQVAPEMKPAAEIVTEAKKEENK
jgi:large subunit ribosomal protein L3